jgi:ADP-ribosylglycohydrolase
MSDTKNPEWNPSEEMLIFLQRAESEADQLSAGSAQARVRALGAAVAAGRYEQLPRIKALLLDDAPIVVGDQLIEVRNEALAALQELYWPVTSKPELGRLTLRLPWQLSDMWRIYREAQSMVDPETLTRAGEKVERYLAAWVQPAQEHRDAVRAYCVLRELGWIAYEQQDIDPTTTLMPSQREIYLRQVERRPSTPCLRIGLTGQPDFTIGWMFRTSDGPWQTRFSDHPARASAIDFLSKVKQIARGGVPNVEHDAEGLPKRHPDDSFVVGPVLDERSEDALGYLRSLAAFLSSHYAAEVILDPAQRTSDSQAARLGRACLALDGLSVGDAFGERFLIEPTGVHTRVVRRQLDPAPWSWTDDTQMALSIVEMLAERGSLEPGELATRFAGRYEPHRGYGRAAHELLQRIRDGEPWEPVARGLFNGQGSMGNGAAMRAAPIGAYFADDLDRAAAEAHRSAISTHTHPDGVAGAVATAVAAALMWQTRNEMLNPRETLLAIHARTPAGAVADGIAVATQLPEDISASGAARALGNGALVLASDTVPFALWSALHHANRFDDALWVTASVLGDIDTTCAIVAGLVAMRVGATGIPALWRSARELLPADVERLFDIDGRDRT